MIYYKSVSGWMEFPRLSMSNGLTATYTIAYRLKDKTGEHWTSRFNRFKNKENKAEWGAATVMYEAVPALMKHLGLNMHQTMFLPVLSSGETQANPNRSICWMTKECAGVCGANYSSTSLAKNIHQKIHNIYDASARSAELDKANYQAAKMQTNTFVIFDDIVTRGDTLSRVALAIHAANPGSTVYGIALAKSERVAYCPNPDNDHVPASWDNLWQQGENEHAQKNSKV
ncbi:phosphoribosyltransferase [Rhodobacter capsulatus]|uniref:phosphoribosyltransferase n=1 Tax=Rhodobacter capsulatus TaxID=1061 RepID=UPI000AE0ECB7|nr:phosphoribosyltransferase [Rhodobacter capsulatus]PZX23642.1 hypothetical protein LY44_02267 [Rhodobacter capsulatus]QNR62404.1 phosphoribosyltransferase [Rhodobacter capsulatus]